MISSRLNKKSTKNKNIDIDSSAFNMCKLLNNNRYSQWSKVFLFFMWIFNFQVRTQPIGTIFLLFKN
jgi:hypothetical protein